MILELVGISKEFNIKRDFLGTREQKVRVLDGVSLSLNKYECLGIVGESGCGKTTLAKIILGLIPQSRGEVNFNGEEIVNLRKDVQIIFQNPYNSLNPRMRIFDIITEPILIHRLAKRQQFRERSAQALGMVGIEEDALWRFPFEFSGGQRQRICIARALACQPKLLILDEPISSLDLTLQAQMLSLFKSIKNELNLTYIFISHNLAVIRHIADRVLVMKDGVIVEEGQASDIFSRPTNSYTRLLLESAT